MTVSVGFMRPPERIAETAASVRKRGMVPYAAPSLVPAPAGPEVFGRIANMLETEDVYFVIFASITAVESVCGFFGKDKLLALFKNTKIACTGPKTEEALKRIVGRGADLVPGVYSGAGAASEISGGARGKKVMILRSAEGDPAVVDMLSDAGAEVTDEAVYFMRPAPFSDAHKALLNALGRGELDAMLFTSPASFALFLEQAEQWLGKEKAREALGRVYKVAIGKPTSRSLENKGFAADAVPDSSTFEGMLDAVERRFS